VASEPKQERPWHIVDDCLEPLIRDLKPLLCYDDYANKLPRADEYEQVIAKHRLAGC